MAMTNTERIEANNAELRELIEAAEALPDAGSDAEMYDGEYAVTPDFVGMTLPTAQKLMQQDVVVNPIAVSRTSNASGGTTVYIGGIING